GLVDHFLGWRRELVQSRLRPGRGCNRRRLCNNDRYRRRNIRSLQFRAGGGKHDAGGKPGEMALPGNSISGWEQAFQHSAIGDDAGGGEQQCADLALKNSERGQVTEETKNKRTRADMVSAASYQPGSSA